MGDFIAGLAIGFLFGILGFIVGVIQMENYMNEKYNISESIEDCQRALPREEFCTLIAVPESEVK